jgi:hypothetical protein
VSRVQVVSRRAMNVSERSIFIIPMWAEHIDDFVHVFTWTAFLDFLTLY